MKRLILTLVLALWAGWAWGATYYAEKIDGSGVCWNSGGWPSDNSGTRICNSDLETASDQAACTELVISAGTYTGTEIDDDSNFTTPRANFKLRGVQAGDTNYSQHAGTVILNGNAGVYALTHAHTGVVFEDLSITGSTGAYYNVWDQTGGTFNRVHVYGCINVDG